jgi:light-regulated signal transduction histidine kinase (bacteriophytochrome)
MRVKERTSELEAANKELEAFTYSVSHDLRAPLRSIDGFSLALLEDYEDRLDETGKDYLHRVRNATQRMGTFIDALLKLSRLARGSIEIEKTDLSKILRHAAQGYCEKFPERLVEIDIQENMTCQADPRLMEVVLENLMANAWKFTSKEPVARITFGRKQIKGKRVFFLKDNGVGFDMKYSAKLFNEFQRLHSNEEFEGTGIGLATVRRIISRHHGKVWAEGEVGKGAVFYFQI